MTARWPLPRKSLWRRKNKWDVFVNWRYDCGLVSLVSCLRKALLHNLNTCCNGLRKQTLERQKLQVQLVTGRFEYTRAKWFERSCFRQSCVNEGELVRCVWLSAVLYCPRNNPVILLPSVGWSSTTLNGWTWKDSWIWCTSCKRIKRIQKEYPQELSINVRIVNDMSAKSVRPAAWYLVWHVFGREKSNPPRLNLFSHFFKRQKLDFHQLQCTS